MSYIDNKEKFSSCHNKWITLIMQWALENLFESLFSPVKSTSVTILRAAEIICKFCMQRGRKSAARGSENNNNAKHGSKLKQL